LVSTAFRVRRNRGRGQFAIDRKRTARTHPLVQLATRFITAQAAAAAAIGLCYSRRHVPSIIITLMLVVALLGLAAVTRTGAHVAWLSAIGFESAFIMFGLIRFFSTRYLGGTLFGIITIGVLLHPAVARAFSGAAGQAERGFAAEPALSDVKADAPG
jgi:ribose/xylose/arabinose/galactoside ABC-type transport system permease subunit